MGNQYSNDDKRVKTVTRVKNVLSPLSPRKKRTQTNATPTPIPTPLTTTNTATSYHPISTPTTPNPTPINTTNQHRYQTPKTITNQWLKNTPSRANYRFEDFVIDNNTTLGEGAFACVKMGHHVPTKNEVAVKIITKAKIPKDMKEYTLTEPSFLSKLSHSNIINLFLTHEDEDYIYLFLEYVKGGDLYSLVESKGQLPQNLARCLFRQLIEAMNYCQQNNVCHRDIKLENVLVDYNPINELQSTVKLIDFGFAADIPHQNYKFGDFPGSMLYAAPELLSGTPYNARISDVYSLGVMLYVMVYGRYPFFSESNVELYYMATTSNASFDTSFCPKLNDLISKMLTPKPGQRITLSDILDHPWFAVAPKDKKDVLTPLKSKVNQFKCEVEKQSQCFKRLSLSPKSSRKNRS